MKPLRHQKWVDYGELLFLKWYEGTLQCSKSIAGLDF